METAYVLITCDLGSEAEVIDELKQLTNVKEAHEILGAYDILTKVESDSVESLRDTISWKIRKLNRVRSTLSLMVIEGQE
jgi:DNA-binding Lrp family transcriptional regulator